MAEISDTTLVVSGLILDPVRSIQNFTNIVNSLLLSELWWQ